ncbi:MAG: 4Fe-4S binding protein [Dehalococcoidia bacterium]|nr:4Fe-4S binding protein [Dehalococcoidia bacterium]
MQVRKQARRINSTAELEALRKSILDARDPKRSIIALCVGTGCLAYGCMDILGAFKREVAVQGLQDTVEIRATGCPGFCERGTLLTVYPQGIFYQRVKMEDVPEIISETIVKGKVIKRLLYVDPNTGEQHTREADVPFYKKQQRLLLGSNSRIDPTSIEDYLAIGGYAALAKAISQMKPEQIIEEIKRSGLRGRGGGGFPAGKKWEETRNAHGHRKYAIVNCDEGDPGAYMDRSLTEGNPHAVLEGLLIGAYAIGASEGFIYVRQEYPLACENLNIAIGQAREHGLLGDNILGSGFSFTVKVHRGAGAFVSGESSAIMSAIEGKVGEPRMKYVHTAVSGIKGQPSNLNNVETWANVPLIINKGADWFRSIGTEGSKGTKIFSLVGKVNNTGLVEIPMGMTLREIIYGIGGGILKGKRFKGVQTGGPSGGILPEQCLDTPVDFDELAKLGSMMGSGGMVVMDEDTCMVDVARYFVDFLCEESCGKCIPCREGLRVLRQILTDICEGRGKPEDIALIQEIAEVMADASLCALGTTAANPVLTTLRYFGDEYEAHIKEKRCPAKFCKNLTSYYIDPDKCSACLICLRNCPASAIVGDKGIVHWIDQGKCTKCGICFEVCPERFSAVVRISGEPTPPPPPPGTKVKREG